MFVFYQFQFFLYLTIFKPTMKIKSLWVAVFAGLYFSCTNVPDRDIPLLTGPPHIEPDYTEITVPCNIAPLNFVIGEEGDRFAVTIKNEKGDSLAVSNRKGIIKIPERKWKKLLEDGKEGKLTYRVFVKRGGEWSQFESFSNFVSGAPVAPYLYYRLLYPGYESWSEISIMQRNLSNFEEKAVVKNNVAEQNCVNCHSFNARNPDNFLFHMRGSLGGTFFLTNDVLKKINLKTSEMESGATYPRWHPSGNFVAFSANKVIQQFHSMESKKIEVSDLASSLVMYDVTKNEMTDVLPGANQLFMDTYPEWSPDGQFLYFCRARKAGEKFDYQDIKYNLYRVAFEPESQKFSGAELVFDAEAQNKSVSFPRISPDGRQLVLTLHDYGCFPVWHKEADLVSLALGDFSVSEMEVNSEFTESYHSWSANGRWMVFSSKRGDGLSARPYISYVDETGKAHKPFVLPQEDPRFYSRFLKTFNIPEFAEAEVSFLPGEIREAAKKEAIQAKWSAR
jgi:hypothetical protein